MNIHLLAESALRSLIMGAIVLAALRLLRVHQIRARRTAWLIVLAGALLMPALVGWQIGPRLLPRFPAASLLQPARPPQAYGYAAPGFAAPAAQQTMAAHMDRAAGRSRQFLAVAAATAAVAGYFTVAFLLLVRLCLGVGFALRLRNHAQRTTIRFAPEIDVRVGARIATPVTIASTVMLPANYRSWDEPTLRVVVTHECAHVRQRDFYVHVAAGLHCALFWFNPFSWWLKRQLSELGEALSDLAAVEQAQSRASYAEILLAFATRAPLAGVAMARASSLSPRIERLLDDRGFEQSFAGKRRPAFVAAGAVLLALGASTSMVRVRAASPDALAASPDAITVSPDAPAAGATAAPEILAIRAGDSRVTFASGGALPPMAGDYIYYQHEGKTYVIQDPDTVAKARTLLAPMEELERMQRDLGRQQAAMGKRQKALGMQQLAAKVDSPDFKRDMAELQRVMGQMDLAHLTPQIDQKALAEIQSRLGEIQGRVGVLMAELGTQQARIGEQQGALGEQQGKLGEEQRRLGERQRKIAEEARRQLLPLIEQAIRDGKTKPLN